MAVKIRLKRFGKIRSPHYRIVVMDARAKRDGKAIEEIGKYHPKNDPSVIEVNSERAQYWLGVGAQATEAVVAIFKRSGDWQQFSGDTSPSGIDPQKEKEDKLARFNAALSEVRDEPVSDAISTKKDDKKAEEPKADEPKADEPKADEPKADESKADEKAEA
ncbi:MAG: 30S ribosomal protein S16 [Propionibacteriaceae bacterium]